MRSFIALMLAAVPASALGPGEVVVVYNAAMPASKDVAQHYARKRGVPEANLIALDLPTGEDISRADYDRKLSGPLRLALAMRSPPAKCILAVYGVPLRVGGQTPTKEELAKAAELAPKLAAARERKDDAEVRRLEAQDAIFRHAESVAAVDSELMLLLWPPYPLARWTPNPRHWQFPLAQLAKYPATLLTARLDGPTPAIAKRLVDDALFAEENGLVGHAYFDARGIGFDPKAADADSGYAAYDESYREAAKLVAQGKLPVTLDDKPELFAAGACPNAALYSGWYALVNYRRCCTFVPGAIAWHLASGEAHTLRDANSKAWCPNLLRDGVAVTLGPVAEPYTIGFPKPAEFFGMLLTGEYCLAEVHARTQYFASWMTVLVGDPLYNPFRNTPRLKAADVFASPKGDVRRIVR